MHKGDANRWHQWGRPIGHNYGPIYFDGGKEAHYRLSRPHSMKSAPLMAVSVDYLKAVILKVTEETKVGLTDGMRQGSAIRMNDTAISCLMSIMRDGQSSN